MPAHAFSSALGGWVTRFSVSPPRPSCLDPRSAVNTAGQLLALFMQALSAFERCLQPCPHKVAMVADAAAVRVHVLLG